jgi:ADP-ribosylglycohydrolase
MPATRAQFAGCLIGTAVGDSLGLPAEGMSREAVAKRFPSEWRHRLIGRTGMCSDDTEHAFLLGQSLLAANGDAEQLATELARRLRWWFIALPAGVGLATARGCLKLWLGFRPERAGVFSAGNGPAMRAPLLGVYYADEPAARLRAVTASTRITHHDPKALYGARLVADAAAALCQSQPTANDGLLAQWRTYAPDDHEWQGLMDTLTAHLEKNATLDELATALDIQRGVTGYVYHTVPMVAYVVLRHLNEPAAALEALYRCGGDTDTTGAIAGALLGIANGADAFPVHWLQGIRNGPLSIAALYRLADALADNAEPISWPWIWVPFRNLFFLAVVLAHGFRRLLP